MNLDFDIDEYLNPLIPRPWLHRLPRWMSWWLGYRATLPRRVPTVFVWVWTFIGAFCGVSVVEAVMSKSSYFVSRQVPNIVGSFGASAVLLYGAIEAPFGQPRPMFIGHTISSILGVAITKLFLLLPPESFDNYLWLAGALSCAVASTVLAMLKIIHPPSGGTALIAATQADIRALGWYYVPVVMLSSVLMIAVGLITNNIQRQYPMYWWTSVPLPPRKPKDTHSTLNLTEVASGETAASMRTDVADEEKGGEVISVSLDGVVLPSFLRLSYDQRAVLDELRMKIKEFYLARDE